MTKGGALKTRAVLFGAVCLVLLTLLAAALRLYRLDFQSLWYDEAYSVYLARMDLQSITAHTAADIQPPLYYYLMHGWIRLFGQAEATVRALSVVFGVLSIPLAFALGWLLFRSRLAGLLGALFVAVSPLHIWYSQEARMYTLLTFLALLSGSILLLLVRRAGPNAAQRGERVWVDALLWCAYTLISIAALYTHYFAFFVLAFQGIYVLLVWGARGFGPRKLVLGGLASGVATLLAYLPWLPHLLARYGTDTSYWPGQLKLGEILVDISLSWVGGESVSESIGLWLALGCGLVVVTCALIIALARRAQARPQTRSWDQYPVAYLLLYLVLPALLILLLSYGAPKFNARYVMVSQPAALLLVAGGLALLWEKRRGLVATAFRWLVASAALLFVLGVAAYADYQAYTAPAFARADFRGVAGYLQEHIAPDETVILSSGHMFPVFDLYAPGLNRLLLPDAATLDTTRTLDYSVAHELNQWLAGKRGVWVVLWQDEVVDPVGYLPSILGAAGEEQPVSQGFSQVKLRHYRFPQDVQFSDRAPIEHPTDLNFGDRLRLLGYSQTGPQQVTLFWQPVQALTEDYLVSVILRDTNNQVWGQWDGRPSAYEYPTNRWRIGQVVPAPIDLVPMPGTPPGDYGLDVGVYTESDPVGLDLLDAAGAAQGKRAVLGAVALSVPAVTERDIEVASALRADAGGGIELVGWDLSRGEAQPGDRLLLTLVWSVEVQPTADYRVRLFITDASGQTLEAGTFPPTNAWHPTSIWLAGQAWRGQSTFRLPIQALPGVARLGAQLIGGAAAQPGPAVEIGRLEVLPTTRSFTSPRPQAPRDASFDGKVVLLGADLSPSPRETTRTLRVTAYWQCQSDMDVAYTVFVHLIGPDGRVVAGHDGEPDGGARPTTGWVPGEFVTDVHLVVIPDEVGPGEYVVEVGLYDAGARNMPRLPVLGAGGQIETDRVIFGPVRVE